uniref:G-protein coupled receptors family 1 profile domain-containing protein n=1 Tax=Meloidogyne enterolobii TaxID=390850 RepID=A0A6V7V338_MELEN|nr:unnamed protein product [Meloidogyne enterolobii]
MNLNSSTPPILDLNTPATLYDTFASAGISYILIVFVGIRWFISIVGCIFNFVLFWITIKDKSLNSSCNYLIAIDALFTAIYQTSNSISMYVVLSGINFINLDICFYLLIYCILSNTMSLCLTFFIGFDRLLSVLFPITFGMKKSSRLSVYCSIGISTIYAFFILWQCWQICITIPKTQVICSISDCYQKDVGQLSFRNSLIIIGFSTLNYILIWILLKYRSDNTLANKKGANYTQRIFKSLIVITSMVVAGWMLNAGSRFIMPLLSLNPLQTFYFSSILGWITNFVMACNALVLYKFSKDYKIAFNSFLQRGIATIRTNKTRTVQSILVTNKVGQSIGNLDLSVNLNKSTNFIPKKAW